MSPTLRRAVNDFSDVAGDAVSDVGFASEKLSDRFNRWARVFFGIMPNWAIDKDDIVNRLKTLLPQGHMTKLNAAALLCAVATNHKHSRFNTVEFLNNFLRLYNADSFERICKIEKIRKNSNAWLELKYVYAQQGLDAVKIRCWAKDLEFATREDRIGWRRGHYKPITVNEIENLVSLYTPPVSNDNQKKGDPSAFRKEDYLPLLRQLRKGKRISETQTAIILCFILHAKETRKDGTSYIAHPMAVANLVRKIGRYHRFNNEEVWWATMAALLHDGGEKTTLKVQDDLKEILPQPIIDTIDALHKKEGESYFGYLERCASNPLSALVKLADLGHNSSDTGDDPTSKQAFVYIISANYIKFRIENPKQKIPVSAFFVTLFGDEEIANEYYGRIYDIAESEDKKDVSGNVIEKALKKQRASRMPSLKETVDDLIKSGKLKPVLEILKDSRDQYNHANSRREENTPIFV